MRACLSAPRSPQRTTAVHDVFTTSIRARGTSTRVEEEEQVAERIAVVTGGGTGIGRAIAQRLADDGLHVIVAGRRLEPLEVAARAIGGSAEARRLDASDPEDVQRFVDDLARDGGSLDALVLNAGGVAAPGGDDLASVAARWRADYDQNVLTAVLLSTAALPLMPRPGGRIVLIGSMSSRTGGGSPSYVAAKSALNGWVIALSARTAPDGITANVVVPGYVPGTELGGGGDLPPGIHERVVSRIASGRAGRPEDAAAAVGFLVSPSAGFLTGQVIEVNGGTLPPTS
jgi:3-oxoacyl-[acyl-carrier protein] reductase